MMNQLFYIAHDSVSGRESGISSVSTLQQLKQYVVTLFNIIDPSG